MSFELHSSMFPVIIHLINEMNQMMQPQLDYEVAEFPIELFHRLLTHHPQPMQVKNGREEQLILDSTTILLLS